MIFKNRKNKKNLDQFLTLERAKIGPILNLTIYKKPYSLAIYIYIYICQRPHLVGTILLFKMSKSRGREEKLRQNKAEKRKKIKLGNMKNPHKFVGFFLANFNYKTGKNWDFWPKCAHQLGSPPHIYIYIYAGELVWYHVLAFRELVLVPPQGLGTVPPLEGPIFALQK